jgi:hypothetical protein
MSVREFGFICGDFSLRQAQNGLLLPSSERSYFPRSLIPGGEQADLTGRYLLRVYHKGSVICKAKVDVAWGADDSQAEPFLAMKSAEAAALSEAVVKVVGKDVELRFTRIAQGLG